MLTVMGIYLDHKKQVIIQNEDTTLHITPLVILLSMSIKSFLR